MNKTGKIGIITIYDSNNYGNRLQNFAVCKIIEKMGYEVETLKNISSLNKSDCSFLGRLSSFYFTIWNMRKNIRINHNRYICFKEFDKQIPFSKYVFSSYKKQKLKQYDAIIAGSDQIWNPEFGRLQSLDLMDYSEIRKKISLSASFGISQLPSSIDFRYLKKCFSEIDFISVREEEGKKIIKEITNRNDVEVLIDPTMLLSAREWSEVIKKPKNFDNSKKYIFCYFLGEFSESRMESIYEFAKRNNCEVINILNKKDHFYESGPSEFLYLIKNSYLICTDSFHSCVFSIIFDKSFIVFEREEKNISSMNSRIETLLNKFKIPESVKFNEKITIDNLNHDYNETFKLLENEKNKVIRFLKKALKDNEN